MNIRLAIAAAALACVSAVASAQQTIKIAYIEGLSGPFANVGEMGLRHLQIAAETVNARGGVLGGRKFEAVAFDNKTSPQEALLAFKSAVGQGIRYIMQGNGSSVALALADAVAKHNERNPSQPVIFLNYAAVDPALTNERCTFGHFRFDADVDMKMQALTNAMAQQKSLRKVYLLNQDYSFGQAVARTARAMLAQKRPDVQIVGEDLHPLGKVKDFAPYVSKIKAAGADAVVTGNWGNDLTLLVKAGKDAGLAVDYYTFYAGAAGGVTVIGDAGVDHVKQVTTWHANIEGEGAAANVQAYRARFPGVPEDLYYSSIRRAVEMLAVAMDKAKTDKADRVGLALEGMRFTDDSGEVFMRPDNHQLLQPLYVSTLVKAGGRNARFDVERTGLGFTTKARIEAEDTRMPTTCAMQRPK
jgi:branched-chain amino acid transport system substrate-binding protein